MFPSYKTPYIRKPRNVTPLMTHYPHDTACGKHLGAEEGIIKDFVAFPACFLSATVGTALLYRQGLSMTGEPEARA